MIPSIFKVCGIISLLVLSLLLCAGPLLGAQACHHDLSVELQPDAHRIFVRDIITVDRPQGPEINFVTTEKAKITSVLIDGASAEYSFGSGRLKVPVPEGKSVSAAISYEAVFNDPIPSAPGSFDNPGFGVAGSITDKGVFLLPDSGWYPRLTDSRKNFETEDFELEDIELKVTAPRGIYAVTAGEPIGHEDQGETSISKWRVNHIGQDLALSAGRYVIRSKMDGRVPIYTYFSPESDALSEVYLKAASSHIAFYEALHGPYPFPKFAIAENFFPTGYGFPSYTLLGGTVLRLPFIPRTSLRHEIAHSWWGNGVLVDYDSGNWCEGLTTYVADYLSLEISPEATFAPQETVTPQATVSPQETVSSRDEARTWRRQALQDYATLAASGEDFPLRQFTSRTSPATRAVGYGKAAFIFHMIRQKLGNDDRRPRGDRHPRDAFWGALRQIFKDRLLSKTSWDDFRDAFVKAGWDPKEAALFFDQWIKRSGAPVLKLQNVRRQKSDSGWRVTGSIIQSPPYYDLDITLGLKTSAEQRIDTLLRVKGGSSPFSLHSAQVPLQLIADPDANIFRLLYPEEIPATVNGIKGTQNLAAILSDGSREGLETFKLLLEGLNQAHVPILHEKEVDLKDLEKKDCIFFGLPNSKALKSFFASAPREMSLAPDKFSVKGFSDADCLFSAFGDSKRNGRLTALFLPVSGADKQAVMAAARKITHYGKYSYLAFSGGVIQANGIWEVSSSPLAITFDSH